jgi:hypothetical protein
VYAGEDNSRCRIFIAREDESDPIRLRRAGRELTNDFERWPVLTSVVVVHDAPLK